MPSEEPVHDSPIDWVRKHVDAYVESGGRKGHRKWGVNTLLLTTRGRTSGLLRRTALIYGRDGDRYLVVASNGGQQDDPSWYRNLLQHPDVDLQVGEETFAARARPANASEKPPLWSAMVSIWREYERYQARCARQIPLVILERL